MGSAALALSTLPVSGGLFARNTRPSTVLRAAIIGTGGRAKALTSSMKGNTNIRLTHACDVDATILEDHLRYTEKELGYRPATEKHFRKLLDNPDIDVVFVATPEHWHTPMAILAMEAGKHVYVEKPCSHNLHENELLVAAQEKYGKICQVGTQQRSSLSTKLAVDEIKEGIIGEVYYGKAWYTNSRKDIGTGKQVPVPATLDWELWQGPAPREPYRDNVHPYNWHWFRSWGTGEIHNNGTHEIDVCRWAMGVDIPEKVNSTGGRLHFSGDDWQYFDTQVASFDFPGKKTIVWEGRSCNNLPIYGRGRGVTLHGTKGSILIDRDSYILYDLNGKLIKEVKEENPGTSGSTADTSGFDGLTIRHIQNFTDAILNGAALDAPAKEIAKTALACHMGNIAQTLGRSLDIDPATGKMLHDKEAMKMWKRTYQPGWEPKV